MGILSDSLKLLPCRAVSRFSSLFFVLNLNISSRLKYQMIPRDKWRRFQHVPMFLFSFLLLLLSGFSRVSRFSRFFQIPPPLPLLLLGSHSATMFSFYLNIFD